MSGIKIKSKSGVTYTFRLESIRVNGDDVYFLVGNEIPVVIQVVGNSAAYDIDRVRIAVNMYEDYTLESTSVKL